MKKVNPQESIDKFPQETSDGILYFAFGSNLSLKQMNQRCPDSVKIGKGILKNYKWIINSRGYANVVKSSADCVEGIVFRITKSDENALDRKEGVKSGCYVKKTRKISMDSCERECLVYIDPITDEGLVMKLDYAKKINAGIVDSITSPYYAEKYIQKFMPDHSFDERTKVWLQILKT